MVRERRPGGGGALDGASHEAPAWPGKVTKVMSALRDGYLAPADTGKGFASMAPNVPARNHGLRAAGSGSARPVRSSPEPRSIVAQTTSITDHAGTVTVAKGTARYASPPSVSAIGRGGVGNDRPSRTSPPSTTGSAAITHETELTAPDGSATTRTVVGVGEKVTFSTTTAGTWRAAAVRPGAQAAGRGTTYDWYAPATPQTVPVTFDGGAGSSPARVDMTVVAPDAIKFTKTTEDTFPTGETGAGMGTTLEFRPLNVSFGNASWKEVAGPGSGATGYFQHRPLPYHSPNPNWLNIGSDNRGITDHAAFHGFSPPWTAGTFEWAIPNKYRVAGEAGAGHDIMTVHQVCELDGPGGNMTVSKGDGADKASVSRSPGGASTSRGTNAGGGGFGRVTAIGFPMGPSNYPGIPTQPPSPQIDAFKYFEQHGKAHFEEMRQTDMGDLTLETGSPFAVWESGSSKGFVGRFVRELTTHLVSRAWDLLEPTIAPASAFTVIDAGRDAKNPDDPIQANQYHHGVTFEIEKVYRERLRESLARVMPRLLKEWNRRTLEDHEKRQKGASIPLPEHPETNQPGVDLQGSHPIDRFVIASLWGATRLVVRPDFAAYRKAFPSEGKVHARNDALRPVKFEWQSSKQARHWIKVTDPLDATADEVAKELFGNVELAYLVTAAPPLFGLDVRKNQFVDKYEKQYSKFYDDKSPGGSVEHEVLAGPQGDDAALNQAAAFKQSNAAPAAVLQELDILVNQLKKIATSTQGWVTFDKDVQEAVARVERRKHKLETSKTAAGEAGTWSAQVREQLDIVQKCERGIGIAKKLFDSFPDQKEARDLAWEIGSEYFAAAGVSDLVVTARGKLDHANQRLLAFPSDFMEAVFRWIRRAILASEKNAKTGKDDPFVKQLSDREEKLHLELMKLRDKLLTNPLEVKDEIERLFKELQDLATGAAAVRNIDLCNELYVAAKDAKSATGWIRSLASNPLTGNHGNDRLDALAKRAEDFESEWNAILTKWRNGDKAGAASDLQTKTKNDKKWQTFFNDVAKEIHDQAKYDAWMTFGLMVGIAIAAGFVGVLVEPLAVAAVGPILGFIVTATTEAAVFTTMSYFLVDKHPSLEGFAKDFGKNLVVFGILKGVSKGWGALEKLIGIEWKAGEGIAQFATLNGIALWEANNEKVKRTGQSLTEAEILKVTFDNLLFLVAAGIGNKALGPAFGRWRLRGAVAKNLADFETIHTEVVSLAEQVKSTKNPELGKKLVERQRALIEAERLLLDGLVDLSRKGWDVAKTAGMTREQFDAVKAAEGSLSDASKGLADAAMMAKLEPVSQGQYLVEPGKSFDQIREHFAADKEHNKVGNTTTDNGLRSFEVTTAEGNIRISERAGKPGEVGAGAERIATTDGAPEQSLGRSNHDGHEGTYLAQTHVVGEHYVRVKRLDSGEYVVTLCSRCFRIAKLAEGAEKYLNELDNNPGRDPHNQPRPGNVKQLKAQVEKLAADAAELEKQAGKLSKAEMERRTNTMAERLARLAEDPALKSVLEIGSGEVQPLGVDVDPSVSRQLQTPQLAADALTIDWTARAKKNKTNSFTAELTKAALETTEAKEGSQLDALKKAHKDLSEEEWGRVEREARRRMIEEYFSRLERGVETAMDGRKAKNAGDPEFAALKRLKDALPTARANALAELAEPWRYTNAGEWEARVTGMKGESQEQRRAKIFPVAAERAKAFKWEPVKSNEAIARANKQRTLYRGGKFIYSVDLFHGRFEVHNERGKHLREINFDGAETYHAEADHDLNPP